MKMEEGENESLYECRRYHIRPHENDLEIFWITMEGEEGNAITVMIEKKEKIAVYVMNEHGQTVDTVFNNLG